MTKLPHQRSGLAASCALAFPGGRVALRRLNEENEFREEC